MCKPYFSIWSKKSEKLVAVESMASGAQRALNCPWTSGLENARQGVLFSSSDHVIVNFLNFQVCKKFVIVNFITW